MHLKLQQCSLQKTSNNSSILDTDLVRPLKFLGLVSAGRDVDLPSDAVSQPGEHDLAQELALQVGRWRELRVDRELRLGKNCVNCKIISMTS